jgi:hypothetical protein
MEEIWREKGNTNQTNRIVDKENGAYSGCESGENFEAMQQSGVRKGGIITKGIQCVRYV